MGESPSETVGLIDEQGLGQDSIVSHTWPTWSPDGQNIAVSRVTAQGTDRLSAEVYSITTDGQITKLYQNPPGVTPLIADKLPSLHVLVAGQQAPDLPCQGFQTLDLLVSSIDAPEQLLRIINGAPLYLAWATDSLSIRLHVGEDVLLLDLTTPAGPMELGSRSTAFRAPAWSHVTNQMAYIYRFPQGRNTLFVTDHDGRNSRSVTDVGEAAAFLWSPTGNSIAILDTDAPTDPFYTTLRVVDLDSGTTKTLTDEQVVAFFWFPDGEKIACGL